MPIHAKQYIATMVMLFKRTDISRQTLQRNYQ